MASSDYYSVAWPCCEGPRPFHTYDQLQPTEFTLCRARHELTIGVELFGRFFNFVLCGSLCPYGVRALERNLPGSKTKPIHQKLAELLSTCYQDTLNHFCRQKVSLRSFLHIWTVKTRSLNGNIFFSRPSLGKRATQELFHGVEYEDKDLPWHNWASIEVIKKISKTDFLVKATNQTFGCYVPDGTSEFPGWSVFLGEVERWKSITEVCRTTKCNFPLLRGFVRSRCSSTKLQGVLYDWVRPSEAVPTLSDVDVDEVPLFQRELWFKQVTHSVSVLHKCGSVWSRSSCRQHVTDHITITAAGDAYLRKIHFGHPWKKGEGYCLIPSTDVDSNALVRIYKFLKLDPRSNDAAGPGPCGSLGLSPNTTTTVNSIPFRFLDLSGEIRNMVYKIILVSPRYIRWSRGYRHQNCRWGLPAHTVAGNGLLRTSRQVRRESLSMLITRNKVLLPAVLLKAFLRSSLQAHVPGQCERVGLGPYVKKLVVELTLTSNAWEFQEQCKGIMELRVCCPSSREVEVLIDDRSYWYWGDNPLVDELKKLRGIYVKPYRRRTGLRP